MLTNDFVIVRGIHKQTAAHTHTHTHTVTNSAFLKFLNVSSRALGYPKGSSRKMFRTSSPCEGTT